MPAAEVDVTVPLVRSLLEDQHPDLAALPLRVVAHGWDNVVLRLGDRLAVRMPRRTLAAELVAHEQRWLPVLAPHLPVAVPSPVRVGRPSDGTRAPAYPWAWSVVPWFDGHVVATTAAADRRHLARPLAEVVTALHRPAPDDAPHNPYRGVPVAARDATFRDRVVSLGAPEADGLLRCWERARAAPPWNGPALWLHGDLHPANILVSDGVDGVALSALLDFGDLTAGDPASDLATAWLTFDGPGRVDFQAGVRAAGYADAATWERARGWAALFAVLLLTSSDDAPVLRAIGEHAVAQVLDVEDKG